MKLLMVFPVSVMESISMGVPILAYPMASKQKLNKKFINDVLGVNSLTMCSESLWMELDGRASAWVPPS
jgi:hypothetical protein